MAISASQIVSVPPRVISAGGTDLEIVGLILTDSPLCVFPGAASFTSKAAVGAYFGLDSDEYFAASKYFLGYDNSFKKPSRLYFARLATEDLAASLIGGAAGSIAELKEISNGSFTITVDGEDKEVSELDFSEISTQSEAAEILADKIGGVTVEYNSNLNSFVIASETAGASSSIAAAIDSSDGAADVLGLTASSGAVISEGSDALTPSAVMDSIINLEQNWVSFTTLKEAEPDDVLAFAAWTNEQDGEYLYCPYTTNASDAIKSNAENLPNTLAETEPEGVVLTFGDIDHAILVMSIAASIDWNRTNGLVTFAFKSQNGLAASVTEENTASDLLDMNVNFYGRYATRNDDFIFYYQGKMIGGDFGFADAYIGNLWLRNALQVSIMSGLNQAGRVPYTEEGYSLIRAWCSDPINRALKNGAIDPGVELSESQKAELYNEIGSDVSSQIYTDGFYLQIEDPGASARVERDTPTCGLWYTYGGSVHKVTLPVTAVL